MLTLEACDLLTLWERGLSRQALDRSALLCAWSRPDVPPDAIADLPLGIVTASLLALRTATFGSRLCAHVDCARCGERLSLDLDTDALVAPATPDPRGTVFGYADVRAPTLRDLAAVADEPDVEIAVRRLLARCASGIDPVIFDAPADVRAIEDALETLDPNADLAIDVACVACGHRTIAQLDAGAVLWDEIDTCARGLLVEVDALARAYGWSEREVLALGAARRSAYLAMVRS